MSKELEYKPTEIQKLISTIDGVSDYSNLSVEQMDYMMKCALKYQQLHESWHNGIENKEPTIFYLRKSKEVIEDFKMPKLKPMV